MAEFKRELWVVIGVLTLCVIGLAPQANADATRLVARLDEPFEVNGHRFPTGMVKVRVVGDYSPISTVNEISVDGETLGLVLARQTAEPSERDELIFTRMSNGDLVLSGIAINGEPTRRLISIRGEQPDAGRPTLAATRARATAGAAPARASTR